MATAAYRPFLQCGKPLPFSIFVTSVLFSLPMNLRNTQWLSNIPTRPRMSHRELVALNHAALATIVSGNWTPRVPPEHWDGFDPMEMRIHDENSVLVDITQLHPSSAVRTDRVNGLTVSISVRIPAVYSLVLCS